MPTPEETAVAARVLRERLPTLSTERIRRIIDELQLLVAGRIMDDPRQDEGALSLAVAQLIFPDAKQEGG